jgi:serine/threonine protein kinase
MFNDQTGRLSPQSRLQQRYLILEQVGRGGMGAVYKAEDTRFSRRYVAIKEMSQGHLNTVELEMAIMRFQQEADMLASLVHSNLPRITDRFSDQERSYLVMDFIEGKTLLQLIRDAPNHRLPVAEVLHYARQLCDVLIYLHEHRPPIIFRDLKPANVMVTPNGQVFLIDFGIARSFKEGQPQDTFFLGSPGYAPPEQHGYAQTNPRSDLYGFGATLHYCLTGRDPYYAMDRFTFPPVRQINPQVPAELDALIQRLVAQNEWERPTSAREVQQALIRISQEAAAHTSAILPPTTPMTPDASMSPASAPTQYSPPAAGSNANNNASGTASSPIAPTIAPFPSPMPSQRQQLPSAPTRASITSTAPSITSIWTTPFMLLFGVLLVLMIGSSFLVLNVLYPPGPDTGYGWAFLFETVLSLLLLLVAGAASRMVRGPIPRTILSLTSIAALVSGIAFLGIAQTDVSTLMSTLLQSTTPEQPLSVVFTIGLAAASIVSLFWLVRPFTLLDRAILAVPFGLALICTVVQAQLQLLPPAGGADLSIQRHIVLLVALIALIQGTLVAVQMERVRENAKT